MPGIYTVNFSDPTTVPITIYPAEGDTSTSMKMTGYLLPVYGETFWENFLHLLENFSSSTPPSNPTRGQFWVNTSTTPGTAYVYDPTRTSTTAFPNWHFQDTAGIVRSTTSPVDTRKLWYDTTDKALKHWVDSAWKSIIPISVGSPPPSPYLGQVWHDSGSGEIKFWSSGNQWRPASIPNGTTLAVADAYPGLMWYDASRNVMRFHRTTTSRWGVSNLFSPNADEYTAADQYNGQFWFDSTSTPASIRMFDGRYNNPALESGEQNWHTAKEGFVVSTTAPPDTTQLWYNPSTPKSLSFWTGTTWENILWCATMAKACDYNKLVAKINPELTIAGMPTMGIGMLDPVPISAWDNLFSNMVTLALYWNIPYPFASSLGAPTTVQHCNDSACGWHSILRKFEKFLCALHYIEDSDSINPVCGVFTTPLSGRYVRTAPWEQLIVSTSFTFGSSAALDEFFTVGGSVRINAELIPPTPPYGSEISVWRTALQLLETIEFTQHATRVAGATYGVGILDFGATDTVIATRPVARLGSSIELSGRRVGNTTVVTLTLRDLVTDGDIGGTTIVQGSVVNVGPPCRPTPLPTPVVGTSAIVYSVRHTAVGNWVGTSLREIAVE